MTPKQNAPHIASTTPSQMNAITLTSVRAELRDEDDAADQ